MALTTGSPQSPSGTAATPTVDTAIVIAIRRSIQPRTGWWQFEFQPWHYWTAITSAVVLAVGFGLIAYFGLHR